MSSHKTAIPQSVAIYYASATVATDLESVGYVLYRALVFYKVAVEIRLANQTQLDVCFPVPKPQCNVINRALSTTLSYSHQ